MIKRVSLCTQALFVSWSSCKSSGTAAFRPRRPRGRGYSSGILWLSDGYRLSTGYGCYGCPYLKRCSKYAECRRPNFLLRTSAMDEFPAVALSFSSRDVRVWQNAGVVSWQLRWLSLKVGNRPVNNGWLENPGIFQKAKLIHWCLARGKASLDSDWYGAVLNGGYPPKIAGC